MHVIQTEPSHRTRPGCLQEQEQSTALLAGWRTGNAGTAPAAWQISTSVCSDDGAHVRTSSNQ